MSYWLISGTLEMHSGKLLIKEKLFTSVPLDSSARPSSMANSPKTWLLSNLFSNAFIARYIFFSFFGQYLSCILFSNTILVICISLRTQSQVYPFKHDFWVIIGQPLTLADISNTFTKVCLVILDIRNSQHRQLDSKLNVCYATQLYSQK